MLRSTYVGSMKFTRLTSQLLLFWLLNVSIVDATIVHQTGTYDINVVSIAVDDQTEGARRRALITAFQQVVIKMSGDSENVNSRLLANYTANDYLVAYQYEMIGSQLNYVATFDKQKMQQLLRLLNLPIWEARRPDTLLWLIADIAPDFNSKIVAEGEVERLSTIVSDISNQRGIKITLPVMDIEDRVAVTEYDVAGRFMNPILAASERYGLEHLVVVRVRDTPIYSLDQLEQRIKDTQTTLDPLFSVDEFRDDLDVSQPYQLEYTFYTAGSVHSGVLAGPSFEQLLIDMLSRYADKLGQQYAVQLNDNIDSEVITLHVNNIDSLRKYTEVIQFLNQLTLVDAVILTEQTASSAKFQVNLLTKRDRLVDTLILDGRLMPILNEFSEVIDDSQFTWVE